MSDSYLTINGPAEGIYREKMSKFLAFAHPVDSAEEARRIIAKYQNEYHDARHVCWAYMIGADRKEFQSNDNGEPSGTAGKPILGQINSFGLTDIVIAVVRYFGGIKLGTSGLIVAYREAAREALEAAEIVERHVMQTASFTFPYEVMNDVMKVVKQNGISILDQQFDNICSMTVTTRSDNYDSMIGRLSSIDYLKFLE